ncbi:D-2-hydroxyacid dehydrogenase [Verrucomicrobium spinosum]|uniref:D-2-hydroxyacid dehydrogenase n=1 Tax=Verrucomicrobium spinosum TaxID=2736 RepID=UPI0001744D76|nr:D-2-hydroxyacid dehydrogenase [Verrucomicrobium spinosum]
MTPLKIFTDIKAPVELLAWFQEQIQPHQLLLPTQPGTSVLAEAPVDPLMAEADILLGQPRTEGVLSSPRVRWLQVSSAGFTRYDTPEFRLAAQSRGLTVTNSSGVYDQACAEHVFSFMLAQARLLPQSLGSHLPNGSEAWMALRHGCRSLQGQSILIAGYGAIAARLVKLLAPFDMNITAMRRTARGDEGIRIIPPESLLPELPAADHVINILPENAESRGLFGTAHFSAMKPGAIFYNIGRGTTVDQTALASALPSGKPAAAWLDVTDPEPLPEGHPLRELPNCFITPHIAGGHHDELDTVFRHFLDNFDRHLAGKPLNNRVM